MSLIAVEAALTVADPAQRDAIVAASIPFQRATREEESGCIVYCFAADPAVADRIQVYELWESEEALALHFKHHTYADMRNMLNGSGLKSAVSRKHRIDATASVYNEAREPIAGFD